MMQYVLETRDLVKRYGSRTALDGFSLNIPRGAVMGLVGENGAGKTTWMLSVAGLLRLDSGEVNLLGRGPFRAALHSGRISLLPQDSALPSESRVQTMLYRLARMQGMGHAQAVQSTRWVLGAMDIADRAKSSVRSLSHGMRMRCLIAQCFIGNPELVILDEPLNGLDPVQAQRVRAFLKARAGRQTIVISSHNLHDIEALCTHVAFVEKGRVSKMSTLGAITGAQNLLNYTLRRQPAIPKLEELLPGAQFEWKEREGILSCLIRDSGVQIEEVNRRLLPYLADACGVLSVSSGQSLEKAYFGR